jgi:hypothetical protein
MTAKAIYQQLTGHAHAKNLSGAAGATLPVNWELLSL